DAVFPATLAAYPSADSGRAGPRAALREKCAACALLGLAPGGVCQASRVAPAAGALLPHRFTLTAPAVRRGLVPAAAVCFLLHFPGPCGRSGLPTTLSCGARTFLSQLSLAAAVQPTPS